MKSFRIVICVDIEAESPAEAYVKMSKELDRMQAAVYWESTDEWYDENGNPIPEERVCEHRLEGMRLLGGA